MSSQVFSERQTKYCAAVEKTLLNLGHATNAELLHELRSVYPTLSATTVHRVTTRLAQRGKITISPPAQDGSLRYDANLIPHDHFMCSHCGRLMDTDVKAKVAPILEKSINGCNIAGRLVISGICKECSEG